jgi:hypothetical protein
MGKQLHWEKQHLMGLIPMPLALSTGVNSAIIAKHLTANDDDTFWLLTYLTLTDYRRTNIFSISCGFSENIFHFCFDDHKQYTIGY